MSSTSTNSFGRVRSFVWPIHRHEIKKFIPLLIIYALICFNYSLLRAAKDTLVICAPSSGAEAIPFIKVWAIMPMAILFTLLFSKLVNKYSQENVFYIMMAIFLTFFILFATVFYPYREFLHPHGLADSLQNTLPKGFQGFIAIFRNWTFTLYYVMAELWSTMIMTVLFWGFANQITEVNDAKRFYGILGVGANIATIAAGQISVLLSTNYFDLSILFGSDPWGQSLGMITTLVIVTGIATLFVFRWYNQQILKKNSSLIAKHSTFHDKKQSVKMGLKKNFAYLAKSKYLVLIAIVVVAYNMSFNMIEIVWKDQVKALYPNPLAYNAYMGKVLTMMGVISTLTGMFICGNVIRKFGWTISAMVTPAIILVTGVLFFSFILAKDNFLLGLASLLGTTPLYLAVFFGTMQNTMTRASKYTLFDATKEISFIPLSSECKLKGKAAIDGVGSRLGKSGGSIIHQLLLVIFGTVSLSTPYVGIILFIVILGYIASVKSLGRRFKALTESNAIIDPDVDDDLEEDLSLPKPTPREDKSTQEALV